jgi:glutathione S-transferase
VLLTDDGAAIAESETILDYLEDLYPSPPLRPIDPLARAQMRNAIRILALYVMVPVIRLLGPLNPSTRDQHAVDDEVVPWRGGLGYFAHHVMDEAQIIGSRLTLADFAVPPALNLCRIIGGVIGLGGPLASHPSLAGYAQKVRRHAPIERVLTRIENAIKATEQQAV